MTPLVDIHVPSIYFASGARVDLPRRMAVCTPDTRAAILALSADVAECGGALYLSDLFRSYDMQFQSNLDWSSGRKRAFSPPPGGSMHEAGRAMDIDLKALKMTLSDFWPIAKTHGFSPVIKEPRARELEAWHFDRRGSHQLIYAYYAAKRGANMKPYAAMAASAILSAGIRVDAFGTRQMQLVALMQSGLIRLGHNIGNLDGILGERTRAAIDIVTPMLGPVKSGELATMVRDVSAAVQAAFPDEFDEEESQT